METLLDFEKPVVEMEAMIEKLKKLSAEHKGDFRDQIEQLERRCEEQRKEIYEHLSAWQVVQIARFKDRPILKDYISLICDDFVELHGDRRFGDDQALIGGFAAIGGERLMLIGHNKGKSTKENIERNFGQARPEGYRKALRLMKLAEKYGLPVVTFIDTSGAYPGIDGEERGVAEAIARNLAEMSRLQVPIVALIAGEGGSGGALAVAVGDVVLMMQHAIYSVITPEGCAAILWREGSKAPLAAQALRLTAPDLLKLGVIDEIVPEPVGGAHKNYRQTADSIRDSVLKHVRTLKKLSNGKLLAKRFERLSSLGVYAKV